MVLTRPISSLNIEYSTNFLNHTSIGVLKFVVVLVANSRDSMLC